jgi:hypothetical protein
MRQLNRLNTRSNRVERFFFQKSPTNLDPYQIQKYFEFCLLGCQSFDLDPERCDSGEKITHRHPVTYTKKKNLPPQSIPAPAVNLI